MEFEYKSPLLLNSPFKKSSFDVWPYIPPEDKVRLRARKTKIKDYQSQYENSLEYWSGNDYHDRNYNGVFDEGDDHKFYITIFTSRDAELLSGINQSITALDYEIILLLEDNSRDRNSAPAYYVQTGKNVRKDIKTKENFVNLKSILQLAINSGVPKNQLTEQILEDLIKSSLNSGFGHYKEHTISESILEFVSPVFSTISDVTGAVADGISFLIESIEKVKISSDRWNYDIDDPDADLFFFPGYNNLNISEEGFKNAIGNMKNKMENQLNAQRSIFMSFSLIGQVPNPNAIIADGLIQDFFDKTLKENFRHFEALMEPLFILINKAAKGTIVFINAFLCGLWNSFVSLIQGILFIFQLVMLGFSGLTDLLSAPERLDQFNQELADFNFSLVSLMIQGILDKAVRDFIANFDELILSLRVAHIGYAFGAIVEFLLELCLGAIIPGVGAVFTAIGKTFKFIGVLKDILVSIFKKAFKIANKDKFSLAVFSKLLLKTSQEKIIKIFADISEAISKWIKNLPLLISGISQETIDLFTKYGITIERKSTGPVIGSGFVIKSGDDLYRLIRNGKPIPKLTKKDLKAIAAKIKKMSNKDASNYLDELFLLLSKRLSLEAQKILLEYFNAAWQKLLKLPARKRKGAVCALEHPIFGIFVGQSLKGLPREVFPSDLHPLLIKWLKSQLAKMKTGEIPYINQLGKCAEVQALSKLLWKIDPQGKINHMQAYSSLNGTISKALRLSKDKSKHGNHFDACDSCDPMLNDFNIVEDKFKL